MEPKTKRSKSSRPLVGIVGTGGTISCSVESSLDVLDYFDGPKPPQFNKLAHVLSQLPAELQERYETVPIELQAGPSMAFSPSTWNAMAELVTRTAAEQPEIVGFVVTHGTATMEESAYALSLVLKVPQPVCFVGAQRPSSAVGFDGTANLIAGIRVAAAPATRGHGVLVVMNDEVHAARDVSKTSNYRLDTFRSFELGPLGVADGDGVHLFRRALRKHTIDTPFVADAFAKAPRVDISWCYAGADGTATRAFVQAGAAGIVSAGFPPGALSPGEAEAIKAAVAKGVIVVQSSRAVRGRVATRWALSCGEFKGIIASGDLSPLKARILLMAALSLSKDPTKIQEFFDNY